MELEVIESTPVPADERITVKASYAFKPDTERWQDKPGIVAWNLSLAPGQTQAIAIDYGMSYPKGAQVLGLPVLDVR